MTTCTINIKRNGDWISPPLSEVADMSLEDIIKFYDGTDMIVPCDHETGRLYICGTKELIDYYTVRVARVMSVPEFMATRKIKPSAKTSAAPATRAIADNFEGAVLGQMVLA